LSLNGEKINSDMRMAYKVYTVPTASKAQYRKNIFRYAYGGVLGNEDPDNNANTEDGWKYRGKGAIQLTGKDNYERNQNEIQEWFNLNYNLVTNPDLVSDNPSVIVYSSVAISFKMYLNLKISMA
jgi:predicted chitinase